MYLKGLKKYKRVAIFRDYHGKILGFEGFFVLDARRKDNTKELVEYQALSCFKHTTIATIEIIDDTKKFAQEYS